MDITIVLPVSRADYLTQVFDGLKKQTFDHKKIHLFIYVDGDHQLYQKAERFARGTDYYTTVSWRKKGLPTVGSVPRRRKRIADIHNEIKGFITTEYVFLTEDDTVIPDNAIELLYQKIQENNIGFVSGIELGRWGYSYIGVWKVDCHKEPVVIESLLMQNGLVEVDCAGFYCMLTKKEYYQAHEFKPYEKILGPDFMFGIYLKQKELQNFAHFDIKCDHLTKRGKISYNNIQTATFIKLNANQWRLSVNKI